MCLVRHFNLTIHLDRKNKNKNKKENEWLKITYFNKLIKGNEKKTGRMGGN